MAEKPAWSFQLPAEHQNSLTQPRKDWGCRRQSAVLILKIKGQTEPTLQWQQRHMLPVNTNGRDAPEAATDIQRATTLPAVALP